jgi:hypothetical protein
VLWVAIFLGLEYPAAFSLFDCRQRPADEFPGGEADKRAWTWWLVVAVATAWALVGNGIVLGYYWSVVKRTTPLGRR